MFNLIRRSNLIYLVSYKKFCRFYFNDVDEDSPLKRYELYKPGENFKAKNYIVTKNTHSLLQQHLRATGGKIRTRFPPEPNGLIHIGHAKSININFGLARSTGGLCFLRYDDTNPEKGKENFADSIAETIRWLGFEPDKVTYASDYFEQLYEWAKELIEKDLAYVCHEPPDTIRQSGLSPWRCRPVSESLSQFEVVAVDS